MYTGCEQIEQTRFQQPTRIQQLVQQPKRRIKQPKRRIQQP